MSNLNYSRISMKRLVSAMYTPNKHELLIQ